MSVVLFDLIGTDPTPPTTGGSWEFVGTGSAPAAPTLYDDPVDFTGYPNGSYPYEYTVVSTLCTQTSTVTNQLGSCSEVKNDDCDSASTLAAHNITTDGSTTFNTLFVSDEPQETTSGCGKCAATASADPPWSATVAADVWYKVVKPSAANDYTVTVIADGSGYGSSGLYPLLAVYTGTAIDCSANTEYDYGEGGQQVSVVVAIPSSDTDTWLFIRVGCAAGQGGLFTLTINSVDLA